MSEPYIGEIRMFAGNFAPRGWAFCNGQTLAVSQYAALFSILGTTYGGNGQTTFQLPNLQGRVPVHPGTGQGLPPVVPGEVGGTPTVTLTQLNLPAHTHNAVFTPSGSVPAAQVNVTDTVGTLKTAAGNMLAQTPAAGQSQALIYAPGDSPVSGQLSGVSGGGGTLGGTVQVGLTGANQPVSTMPPYLGVNFIIALQGVFPSRN